MRKLLQFLGWTFLVSALATLSGCATGSISANSKASSADKIKSILLVDSTSSNSAPALGNQQTFVSTELRKQLAASGVAITAIKISSVELDPAATVQRALAKSKASHVMQLSIPSGTILSSSQVVQSFVVRSEVRDAATRTVVWRYSANVVAGSEARASEVAASLISSLRKDGLL
jgi:hypothetical protein